MKIKYLLKEAKYYKKLGKGHLNRMTTKFILAKTPVSKLVNGPVYDKIYAKKVAEKIKTMKPYSLQIENTNLCNATCIMCPHTIMKRKAKIMTQEEFEKICKNVLNHEKIKLITLTGFGEPMIDKEIDKKIEWLNKNYPEVDIDIYSNASLLTKELSEKLLKLKIHKINFSINGTLNSYKQIMGLNYEKTKTNIIYFLEKQRELNLKYPLTNVSLMILRQNKEEIEEVIEFWKEKTDSIMAYVPSNWAGGISTIDFVEKNPFKEKKRWPCMVLWSNVTVDVEGNVIMCCRDYESAVKFGNLNEQNISEIRNSEKFQKLLEKQANYDYKTPKCITCDNAFDSTLSWWE